MHPCHPWLKGEINPGVWWPVALNANKHPQHREKERGREGDQIPTKCPREAWIRRREMDGDRAAQQDGERGCMTEVNNLHTNTHTCMTKTKSNHSSLTAWQKSTKQERHSLKAIHLLRRKYCTVGSYKKGHHCTIHGVLTMLMMLPLVQSRLVFLLWSKMVRDRYLNLQKIICCHKQPFSHQS